MLLSKVIPMAKATPASDMTLMVRPVASRPRNAAMVQMGIPTAPTKVAEAERREQIQEQRPRDTRR